MRKDYDNRVSCYFKPAKWMEDYTVDAVGEILKGICDNELTSKTKGDDALVIVTQDVPVEKRMLIESNLAPFTHNNPIWLVVEQKNGTTFSTCI